MFLITEKSVDFSLFPKSLGDIEFAERDTVICSINKKSKYYKGGTSTIQIGYIYVNFRDVPNKLMEDFTRSFPATKSRLNKSLGDYGQFYSMTPKQEKHYYVIGMKFSGKKSQFKDFKECLNSLNYLKKTITTYK